MTGEDIYAEVKSWGGWREFIGGSHKRLTATDPIHGGVSVGINKNGIISIYMPEKGINWTNDKGFCDAYGNLVPDSVEVNHFIDENGKFVLSSGWSYEARQLVKKVLALAYPETTDEAYQAILSVMKQEIREVPSISRPSAARWIDGRGYEITLDQGNYLMSITIYPPDAKEYYDTMLSGASTGVQAFYSLKNGNRKNVTAMYELDKG